MTNFSQSTDEQLLARFARGDRAALGSLAERHESNLLGLATGLLDGRGDLARDAVQDAWVRVIKYAKSFDGRSSFRTWMYRIVINRCRDMRASGSPGTLPIESLGEESLPATGLVTECPLRLAIEDAGNEEIRAALRGQAAPTRLMLLLCYHRGLTHPQAAEVMGIPVGTLKSRLSAALGELRGALGGNEQKAVAP